MSFTIFVLSLATISFFFSRSLYYHGQTHAVMAQFSLPPLSHPLLCLSQHVHGSHVDRLAQLLLQNNTHLFLVKYSSFLSLSPLLSPLISLPLFSLSKDRRFISPSVPSVSPFCDWPPLDRWPGSHTPCWVVQSTACRLLSTHNESKETPPTKHVDSTYCGATLDIQYRWLYIYEF